MTFAELTEKSFTEIRRYARADRAVTIRLLETIGTVGTCTRSEEDRAVLRQQALLIFVASRDGLPDAADRQAVEEVYDATLEVLEREDEDPSS